MSAQTQSGDFDIYATFQQFLQDEEVRIQFTRCDGDIAHCAPDITATSSHICASRGYRKIEWCVPIPDVPGDDWYEYGQFEAGTMFELVQALNDGAEELKRRSPNPISLNAGCELFIAFVTLFPHESDNFAELKKELEQQGRKYAAEALTFRDKIAELALGFIKDDSVILTHSHSRVVLKALLHAHKTKRISVYVTESRPRGLGLKTYETLTAAGIPCTVVLDSAVAYVMDRVDFVLVGSEAVVESGGLINYVGSNQMAIIAKAANKPFYALAESYKFHRLFPLSQYDLPTHNPNILSFPTPIGRSAGTDDAPSTSTPDIITKQPARLGTSSSSTERAMNQEQIAKNPGVDYTRPDLISLVFSDVGILTPEGVSQYLVGMFAG